MARVGRGGRRSSAEADLHRREAIGFVQAALDDEAYAGDLENSLARGHGVSVRQARRWIRWALAGPDSCVVRGSKTGSGTLYALARPQIALPPVVRVARWEVRVSAGGVAGLDPVLRRDVALTILALRGLGGQALGAELFAGVAALAGRGTDWAAGATSDAEAACTAICIRRGFLDPGGEKTEYELRPEAAALDDVLLRGWAGQPVFALPSDPDLAAAATAIIGDGPEMAGDRTIVLVRWLAGLGGCASWSELDAHLDAASEQRPRRLRRPEADEPAPTEWGRRRIALAPALAVAWIDRLMKG